MLLLGYFKCIGTPLAQLYNSFVKKNFLILLAAIALSGCAYTPNNYADWSAMAREKGYNYTAYAAPEDYIDSNRGYWAASAKSQEEANQHAISGCSKNFTGCVIRNEGSNFVYKNKLQKINEKYSSINNHLRAEKECKELGFSAESDLSSCKLKLIKSFNQEAAEERKIYYAEEQAKAAQRQAIAAKKAAQAAERRARAASNERSRKMMERGLRSLSGECSLIAGTC